MENLRITEAIKENLLIAAKWLKFLTILGIIGMVFVFIIGIVLSFLPLDGEVPGWLIGICYIIGGALYFYPLKKCYNIVSKTREALNNGSQESLELCASNLKSVLKYFGILSIIGIVIYAIVIITAIALGAASLL